VNLIGMRDRAQQFEQNDSSESDNYCDAPKKYA
jgi:hypothetical protein